MASLVRARAAATHHRGNALGDGASAGPAEAPTTTVRNRIHRIVSFSSAYERDGFNSGLWQPSHSSPTIASIVVGSTVVAGSSSSANPNRSAATASARSQRMSGLSRSRVAGWHGGSDGQTHNGPTDVLS